LMGPLRFQIPSFSTFKVQTCFWQTKIQLVPAFKS
jgi:hypothetical protein